MINLSNGMAGLSLLTGANGFLNLGASAAGETLAARRARAQFTTPEVPPPWKAAPSRSPPSAQAAAVARMKSVVDAPAPGAMPDDVRTAFTAYKALDRLRLLAEAAGGKTVAGRAAMEAAFARGLDDLQTFLGGAPSDVLSLAFAQPARRAESVAVASPASLTASRIVKAGVASARDAGLPGLTGTETFRISLSKTGARDVVTVDLAGGPRPPTLDSVSDAINAAIAAVPARNADGTAATDAGGAPVPRWSARFAPVKTDGRWGMAITRVGSEAVAIDQVGAGDALTVASGVAGAVRMSRIDDPAGGMTRRTLDGIAAVDANATERARLADPKAGEAFAATSAAGIATDAQGFSYVVGTANGNFGANLSDGDDDLFLIKLDSEGETVWRRSLGASGSAQGAAVTVAPNGDVVVAGTVTGAFGTAASDGDMLVARYDAGGDEKMATLVRAVGADAAGAVAAGADGSIFVGGRSGRGDAFVARIDAAGRLAERRVIDSGGDDRVTALAVDDAGNLLALTQEGVGSKLRRLSGGALSSEMAMADLGTADARAIARGPDGSIAVVGATNAALGGTQVNAKNAGRDGFVARFDAGLASAGVTYVGTAGADEIDSAAYLGGALYVGGRTTGALSGSRTGTADGFVGRIDASTGAVADVRQFGQPGARTDAVRVAAAAGGGTALGALGLHRGTLTPTDSPKLVAQTGLRAGDTFGIRVEGGAVRRIVVAADDTLATLADRVRRITGSKATVTTPAGDGGSRLRIEMKTGFEAELIAGADGRDALAKLGLAPMRIAAANAVPANAPRVRPGGSFGLGLTDALGIGNPADAKVALARIKQAISVAQTGYRSLYWDDAKAALVNGAGSGGASTGRERAQMANYQAALDRLSASPASNAFTGF